MRRECHFVHLGVRLSAAALCIAAAGMVSAGGSAPVTDGVKVGTTSRQPHGKPGSGVLVRHSVPGKIAVGETVTLRLQFSGVTAVDGATIEVRDPSTHDTLVSTRLAQRERRTIELPYMSLNNGMQFIDVATTQAGRTTVQSLPLRVGTGELELKPHGKKQTTTTGENVISLPLAEPGNGR